MYQGSNVAGNLRPEAAQEEQTVELVYQRRSENDFLHFVKGLSIQYGSAKDGKLFWSVMADFQLETFQKIAPHITALRDGDRPSKQRVWIERTKKASKDADLAAIVMWLCAFPIRPFYGEIGAADESQAAILHNRVSALLEYNKWLLNYVELTVSPYAIRSRKKRGDGRPLATIRILPSDPSGGAHGSTPDLLILNELTHIKNRWEFVEALLANAAGVPDGMVIVATNAGYKGSKAEIMRDNAIDSKNWLDFIYSKPAPWHNPKFLEDERKQTTEANFRRLWRGQWVSGKGDALDEDDIDRCFVLSGPSDVESGWNYVGGLDLGISHDHSALVILAASQKLRKIRTVYWRAWKPIGGRDVDLSAVQSVCLAQWRAYRLRALLFDPTEAKLMAQQLVNRGVPMKEMSFARTTNLDTMAMTLIQCVEGGILECFDDEEGTLRRDFGKFTIEPKRYGHRLEAVRDEYGHADVGTALVIALPYAVQLMGGLTSYLNPDDDLTVDDSPLTEEERKTMPDELRELIEMEEEDEKNQIWDETEDFLMLD